MAQIITLCNPLQNGLLAALPEADYERLRPHLQGVSFALGEFMYETGGRLDCVYFPTTCVVSLLYTTEAGSTAEMGLTGNDGVVGVALFLGGETTPNRAVVQIAGCAISLKADLLQQEFARGGAFQQLMLLYTPALITQISQTAVCNLHHSVDQQLCRWLLLSIDRLPANTLQMTQELIANMLGVRRQGVTESAGKLEREGLITYRRGLITVLDRDALEKRACECYGVVRRETERLLPQPAR